MKIHVINVLFRNVFNEHYRKINSYGLSIKMSMHIKLIGALKAGV